MALANLKFFSEALGMQTEVYAVLPQKQLSGEIGVCSKEPGEGYKCLYLLHGLSDDFSIWMRRTSIERYAQKYGVCIIMPNGEKSFYTDMKYGSNYSTYISEELPSIMQQFFNVSRKREDNFIAGNSMGGYGAIKTALKKCGSYCAAAGLSSVADIEKVKERFKSVLIPVFGEDLKIPDDENLFGLAEKCAENADKPRIFMGVGTEDFLYADNLGLKSKFEELGYDFKYIESKGDHNWELWDEYIQYVLEWMFGE